MKKVVYCVTLTKMEQGVLFMEPTKEENRLFSSINKATRWLTDNGFLYGQRYFLNYPDDDNEWYHKDDTYMEFVSVRITKMLINDFSIYDE